MSRKPSTVVFYQPDEEETLSRPGASAEVSRPGNDDTKNIRERLRLPMPAYERFSASKSESEDSGVKSSLSTSEKEDDLPHSPSLPEFKKTRKASSRRVSVSSIKSLKSCPSSPMFDFPSFDELFENGGKLPMRLTMHKSFLRQPSFQRYSVTPVLGIPAMSDKQERRKQKQNENADDIEILPHSPSEESRKSFKRTDSIMTQNLESLVYTSWKGSKGFRGYRERLGNAIHHKYCMCCRFESTPFVALYSILGFVLTCAGVVSYLGCQDEILVSSYLLTDGLLSVFIFPTLIMGWTKRIGGCISQQEKIGSGSFWISVFALRILLLISGTFICVYRFHKESPAMYSDSCQIQFFIFLGAVMFEWSFCVCIFCVPIAFFCILYLFAPSWSSQSSMDVS